jgi:PmbA protein
MKNQHEKLCQLAIEAAKKYGATEADAVIISDTSISVRQRLQNPEAIEMSDSHDIGLRVFIADSQNGKTGYKTAIISTNNLDENNIKQSAQKAVEIAKLAPLDEHIRLAELSECTTNFDDLDCYSSTPVTVEQLKDLATRVEQAALAVPKVTNSEGADASHSERHTMLATSKGFVGKKRGTSVSFSVSVIAGDDDIGMETDYDHSFANHFSDLESPELIGKNAGEYAVRKLQPRKIKTCKLPVVFAPKIAKSFIGYMLSAINGASIAKGSSFLIDKLDEKIFPEYINIIEDPLIRRGAASEAFDDEGIATQKTHLIENGVLKTWLLDIRSASKLNLKTNGHASRSISGHPSPSSTNVYMQAGTKTPEQLIAETGHGIYITDAFGMGVNTITGDYSQGANGFMIENGILTYPISEITIAGNLLEMFASMEIANDLKFKFSKNAPTIRVEGITVAGV